MPRYPLPLRWLLPLLVATLLLAHTAGRHLTGNAASAPADPTPFLVQSGCLDAEGRLRPGVLPIDPGCARRGPPAADDPLPYGTRA